MKNIVVIGLLGPTLDMGKQPKRWERWRPTVALCQHEDLLVSRLELLYQKRFKSLLTRFLCNCRVFSIQIAVVVHRHRTHSALNMSFVNSKSKIVNISYFPSF